ncbi:MAG: efflux RND transporter periplasmic adaptor subunit [Burkholderiaceae bacterium]|nr:efflux RND transporter periplasmic adaptor subunit [Burkholderiaceae bacterium]
MVAVLALAGCHQTEEKTEDIRPVRVQQVRASDIDLLSEFAGEVRARVESRLGFRVGGKIVARLVDTGTVVKKGQALMRLDPQDLQLAQAQARAALRAAETSRDFARAELKRYQELKAQNFVSQTILDGKDTNYKAAQANVEAAQAAYQGQANQAGYATLLSDVDGVVTAVNADVGAVVAPGTPVVQVAKSGDKEIVIGLPEDKVDALRGVTDVRVRLWANPNQVAAGKVREVSPAADPATRTYPVRITIPDGLPDAKLGMTAYVAFASKMPEAQIHVPLSALFNERGATSVWVVENHAVRLVPVQPGGVSGNEMVLKGGLKPGQVIVTAGVNQLKPGQKVTVLGGEAAMPKAPAAANPAASSSSSSAASSTATGAAK